MDFAADDNAALRDDWIGCSRFVLQEDHKYSDHAELDQWILEFIDTGTSDPEYDRICHLIYHSTNLDIPSSGLQRLRLELIDTVRAKIERESGAGILADRPVPRSRTGQ